MYNRRQMRGGSASSQSSSMSYQMYSRFPNRKPQSQQAAFKFQPNYQQNRARNQPQNSQTFQPSYNKRYGQAVPNESKSESVSTNNAPDTNSAPPCDIIDTTTDSSLNNEIAKYMESNNDQSNCDTQISSDQSSDIDDEYFSYNWGNPTSTCPYTSRSDSTSKSPAFDTKKNFIRSPEYPSAFQCRDPKGNLPPRSNNRDGVQGKSVNRNQLAPECKTKIINSRGDTSRHYQEPDPTKSRKQDDQKLNTNYDVKNCSDVPLTKKKIEKYEKQRQETSPPESPPPQPKRTKVNDNISHATTHNEQGIVSDLMSYFYSFFNNDRMSDASEVSTTCDRVFYQNKKKCGKTKKSAQESAKSNDDRSEPTLVMIKNVNIYVNKKDTDGAPVNVDSPRSPPGDEPKKTGRKRRNRKRRNSSSTSSDDIEAKKGKCMPLVIEEWLSGADTDASGSGEETNDLETAPDVRAKKIYKKREETPSPKPKKKLKKK